MVAIDTTKSTIEQANDILAYLEFIQLMEEEDRLELKQQVFDLLVDGLESRLVK